jgi:hypothetical protein
MRDCNHSQCFTVFGGAYVSENHGSSHLGPVEGRSHSVARIAAVAGILMLGISAATATKATRGLDGLRPQPAQSSWMAAGFADAVY